MNTKTTSSMQVRVSRRETFHPEVTIRGIGFAFVVHIDAMAYGKPFAYELNGREYGKQVFPSDKRYGAIMRTALGAYLRVNLNK